MTEHNCEEHKKVKNSENGLFQYYCDICGKDLNNLQKSTVQKTTYFQSARKKLKKGERFLLDKEYNKLSEVIVVSQSKPKRILTTVQCPNTSKKWDVITTRLSKKVNNNEI